MGPVFRVEFSWVVFSIFFGSYFRGLYFHGSFIHCLNFPGSYFHRILNLLYYIYI